ncbi:MAG: hypothetical protein K2N87_15905 [Eubacterium sp.]|nr:hypothetical protein [Eubacterium sp.]
MKWKRFFVSLWEKACMTYERTVHIEERLQTIECLEAAIDRRTKEIMECLQAMEGIVRVTDERAQHIESRDVTIEERVTHLEERLRIMDQDKWEELVDRLAQIEEQGRELLAEPGGGILKIAFEKKEGL